MKKLINIKAQVMILMRCTTEGIVKYTLDKKKIMMIGKTTANI